jgi:hypothetical protein
VPSPVKSRAPISRSRPLSVSASGSVTPPRPVMARPHVHARAEQALRAASARHQPSRDACARRRRPYSGANTLTRRAPHASTSGVAFPVIGDFRQHWRSPIRLAARNMRGRRSLSKCNTQCLAACNMTAQNMYGRRILSAMYRTRCATTAAFLRPVATCSTCVVCLGVSVPEADRLVLGVDSECGGSSSRELE